MTEHKPIYLAYGPDDLRKIGEVDMTADHPNGNVWDTVASILGDHATDRFRDEFRFGEACNNYGQQRGLCCVRLASEIGDDAMNLKTASEMPDGFMITTKQFAEFMDA